MWLCLELHAVSWGSYRNKVMHYALPFVINLIQATIVKYDTIKSICMKFSIHKRKHPSPFLLWRKWWNFHLPFHPRHCFCFLCWLAFSCTAFSLLINRWRKSCVVPSEKGFIHPTECLPYLLRATIHFLSYWIDPLHNNENAAVCACTYKQRTEIRIGEMENDRFPSDNVTRRQEFPHSKINSFLAGILSPSHSFNWLCCCALHPSQHKSHNPATFDVYD